MKRPVSARARVASRLLDMLADDDNPASLRPYAYELSPMHPFQRPTRRAPDQLKEARRAPRGITDQEFDGLFTALPSDVTGPWSRSASRSARGPPNCPA
ncbi:hypothetical protein [Streptomyces sp. NPDC006309]|uniref:hypothetical protein n=1 Tax=Streptomyces sp. NPDC006309 TaxID=3156749 RepID=UPI0033AB6DA0